MVQLRHVSYFVATVEGGSVSGAARALHVTQPALSRQLRQLEADLRLRLFDREAGRLRLTRAGELLLPAARDLLAAADRLQSGATVLRTGRVGRLVVAAPVVTLTDVVAPFVATMGPDEPVVDARVSDGVVPAQVLSQGADLAISAQAPTGPAAGEPLAVLPVWAYVPADHPWAGRRDVDLGDVVRQPLIALPRGFGAREALEAALHAAGLTRGELVEAANGTVAQALAASGRGVALVSDDPRFGLHQVAVRVHGDVLSLRLFAAWDDRSVAAPTVEALVQRLSAFIAQRYEPWGS